jgi:hypothetical protein
MKKMFLNLGIAEAALMWFRAKIDDIEVWVSMQ